MQQTDTVQSAQADPTMSNPNNQSDQDILIGRGNSNIEPINPENGSNRGRKKPEKRKSEHEMSNRMKKRLNRKWDGVSRRDKNVDTRPETSDGEKEERRPKKKVACFIGYSGEGYYGMQYNPPMKTIEGEIYDAFAKAGAILKANAVDPGKSSFQRAARTDKGVHAAGNLISLKLMIGDNPAEVVENVNAVLPPQIRIWGIQRTHNAFNSHTNCDSRIYEYILPTHCFLPPKPGSTAAACAASIESQNRDPEPEDRFWDSVIGPDFYSLLRRYTANKKGTPAVDVPDLSAEELQRFNEMRTRETEAIRAFRISPTRLDRIRSAFKVYLGTHNFHNLTVGVPYHSAQAQRYMMNIDVADPKLIGSTEWLRIKIHGQSFMLHQIRKMVGAVLIAIRYGVGEKSIQSALTTPNTIHIPKAPAQGLLLERPIFSGITEKLQKFGNDPLDWEPFKDKIEKFKDDFIYKSIFQETTAENIFHEFINFMDSFKYEPDKGLSMYSQDKQSNEPIEKFENQEEDEDDVKGDNVEG